MFKDRISKELITIDLNVENREQLFATICSRLKELDLIKDGYLEHLNNRETNYPTGLELDGYNIAIPHGDSSYIKRSFIYVIRLDKSIQISKMDDSDEFIEVNLFFILGLTGGDEHMKVLRELIIKIQDKEFVDNILSAENEEEIYIKLLEE